MSTDIELLPLPRTLQHADDADLATHVQDYARANVAHATAAKDAEIEALRAEVAWQKRVKSAHAELHREAKEHAERLAEALRGLKDLMLRQVKWEPCDCGCPQQRTPDGPHSVTWLRAAQQVDIAISKAEGSG